MHRGERLADALGKAHAVTALLALADAHPKTLGVIELADAMNGSREMGRPMAVHLERHGLVAIKERPGVAGRPSYEVRLTPLGIDLAKTLERAVALLPDDEPAPPRRRT